MEKSLALQTAHELKMSEWVQEASNYSRMLVTNSVAVQR